jgi:hypothetical protein
LTRKRIQYELKARRKIREGEELFLSYQDEEKPGDEYTALWSAVQRGIPAINSSKPISEAEMETLGI